MQAVAEGVETAEQLAFLDACRCDVLQGFYFYKPLPPEEFGETLRRQGFARNALPPGIDSSDVALEAGSTGMAYQQP